jgi:hypothetical protein
METATILLLTLPKTFFSALAAIHTSGVAVVGLVSWTGTIGLAVGMIEGIRRRQAKLLWLSLSPLLSHVLIASAFLLQGQIHGKLVSWITWPFLAFQMALLSFLVFRFKGARVPAVSLSIFGMTYALFSAFISTMAFTDTWL